MISLEEKPQTTSQFEPIESFLENLGFCVEAGVTRHATEPVDERTGAVLGRDVVSVSPEKSDTTEEKPRVILLVDDDQVVRNFISSAPNQMGYEVHEASHGEDGLRRYDELGDKIDLIVSDVLMPNLTGPEMIQQLQGQLGQDVPVLFVTGYADTFLPSEFEEDFPGAKRLDKPFSLEELSSSVDSLLS